MNKYQIISLSGTGSRVGWGWTGGDVCIVKTGISFEGFEALMLNNFPVAYQWFSETIRHDEKCMPPQMLAEMMAKKIDDLNLSGLSKEDKKVFRKELGDYLDKIDTENKERLTERRRSLGLLGEE